LTLVIRVVWWLAMSSDPTRFFEPDSGGYVSLASSLSSGHGFAALGSSTPEFIRTPGYPGFLAVIQSLFGDSARVMALVQATFTALFVVPLHRISRRFLDRRSANVTVGLMAVHPLIVYHSTMLLTEALSLLLLMIVVDRLIRHVMEEVDSTRSWLITGATIAVLAHVRPIAYFLTPVVVVVFAVVAWRRRSPVRRTLGRLGCLVVVPIVLIGGWQIRNKAEVDSYRFSGIEAVNMYLYRGAGAIGYRDGRDWLEVREELREAFGGPRPGEEPGPYYDRMYDEGVDILLDDIGATAVITLRGLADTALGDSRDPDRFLSYFDLGSQRAITWAMWAVMSALWVLASIGVVMARRRGLGAAAFVMSAVVLYMVVVSAGPEAYSRFRTPVEPLLWLLAITGIVGVREHRKYPRIS